MKPFDLEAAKRGEPICNFNGTPLKFVAHVPEALSECQVVVLSSDGIIRSFKPDGRCSGVSDGAPALYMATRIITGTRYVVWALSGDGVANVRDWYSDSRNASQYCDLLLSKGQRAWVRKITETFEV